MAKRTLLGLCGHAVSLARVLLGLRALGGHTRVLGALLVQQLRRVVVRVSMDGRMDNTVM